MLVIGVENDIGFAMLIFTLFIALLWITTGRWPTWCSAWCCSPSGTIAAAHLFPQVETRISDWLHPAAIADTVRR